MTLTHAFVVSTSGDKIIWWIWINDNLFRFTKTSRKKTREKETDGIVNSVKDVAERKNA